VHIYTTVIPQTGKGFNMTALGRMDSSSPTYSESENFHDLALEIREQISQEILTKATDIAKKTTLTELEAYTKAEGLAKEGFSTLKDSLRAAFDSPKHSVLMKLFIDASSTYFFSPYQLNGKLEKVLLRQSEYY
jgi:hypothetical protein